MEDEGFHAGEVDLVVVLNNVASLSAGKGNVLYGWVGGWVGLGGLGGVGGWVD